MTSAGKESWYNRKITNLEMELDSIKSRLTDLEKQVEEHRKRWLE